MRWLPVQWAAVKTVSYSFKGRIVVRCLVVLVCLWAVGVASWADGLPEDRANHWHRWRGPDATGVAPHGNPPTDWDEETNVRWKIALPGHGLGSPVVWGDKLFLLTAIKTDRVAESSANASRQSAFRLVQAEVKAPRDESAKEKEGEKTEAQKVEAAPRRPRVRPPEIPKPTHYHQFVVLCLDRHSGEIVWQRTAAELVPHEGHHSTASFASAAPVTDGKRLYASFGSYGVYCYDLDGNRQWKHDLGQFNMRFSFGEGASPALFGNTLVLNCDHDGQSFITALDVATGKPRWKQLREEASTWTTPLIVEQGDVVQVVVSGVNRCRSYDLKSGEILWECGWEPAAAVPTVVAHDGLAFCMNGFRGSALLAIPLGARGDITGTDQIAWTLGRNTPYVPSPLVYEGLLYFTKKNRGILSCVEASTGEVKYEGKRLPGLDSLYASPVAAAGRIYFSGRNGATTVVEHGAEFKVLAENRLDTTIDSTPAIVGGQIYLRGENHLYCVSRPSS